MSNRWLIPVSCAIAPGALAGTHLATLLFFLNPNWPFSPLPLARAVTFYATLLGLATLLVLLPFSGPRPKRARRMLPWSLVVTFALVGLLHGAHASYYSFYLPAGINRRLIRAAIWLSLAAVIAFYTALVHSLRRRPYGIRSRAGLGVLALLSVLVVLERREAYEPPKLATPRPSLVEPVGRPNLAVVAIAGASLDVILPLAHQGQLPFFAAMLEQGSYARLETLEPTRPAPLWTSLATGKYPYQHGVVGPEVFPASFIGSGLVFRLLPVGLRFSQWGIPGGQLPRPQSLERRAMTLWEITTTLGIGSTVIGWPASWPVPSGLSAAYSPEFFAGDPDSAYPPESRDALRAEGLDARARVLEQLAEDSRIADPWPELRAVSLEAATADTWRQRIALRELARAATDPTHSTLALFAALPGLDPISRATFGGYSAVQFDGRRGKSLEQGARALSDYYGRVDAMLEAIWTRLPEPRLLVLVSPYGTRADRGIERWAATLWRQRRLRGRQDSAPDGILLMRGAGVLPGHFIDHAEIADVAPTVLYALGFPVARDLDGRVLAESFTEELLRRRPLTFVPSYETLRSAPLPTSTSAGPSNAAAGAHAASSAPWAHR